MDWWIVAAAAIIVFNVLFLLWFSKVTQMNKHYDKVMEDSLNGVIDDLDEAVKKAGLK